MKGGGGKVGGGIFYFNFLIDFLLIGGILNFLIYFLLIGKFGGETIYNFQNSLGSRK